MPKKVVLLFTLLTLIACFLSYKLGSSPVAFAKARPAPQDATVPSLPPPPAEWVLVGNGGAGALATVTKPGVAGVQHVADCVTAAGNMLGTSPVPMENNIQLLDGNTLIMLWTLPLTAYTTGTGQVSLCGLSAVGTVGNSMTLRFAQATGFNGTSESIEAVNVVGHDAT